MSFGGSLRAAAFAVLFVFGFSVSVSADGPLWNQTGQFAPIAYTNYSSYGYLIYGNTNSSDNSQVWISAELTCQALGGHLTSVSSAAEGTVVYNLWHHMSKNGGKQFGNSTMCAWTGLHNLNGAIGWTDDASLAYLNSTVATNPIRNASFFSDWTSCAAVCGDAIYIRDCDFEPQAFVCKLPSTATPFLGTAANVPAPSNPNTPVYPPAYSSPSPSYPPTYSSPSPSPAYSSPSPSPSPAYPSPSPSPSPAYPPAYGGNVWPNGVIPSCMFFNGYKYCAAAAGVQNAYSWSNAEYYCHLAGAGSLASITSLAELGAILAFFVPNSTAPAFWTGGFKAPFYPAVNIDGNNTWLSAQKGIADPTAGYKMPETYLSHYQLTSYNGSCLNGHGCGVALTYNARGASIPGLQYIDPAFPAWSICKAPYQLVPAPLPPANINATQRAPGEQYVIVPVNVKMQMNSIGCKAMLNNIAGFKYSYKQAAQTSWNNANPTIPIQVGDTDVADPVAACLRRSMGRRLMQATSSSADVNSGSGMNSGVSTTQAAANSGSFQGNMGSNLGPGSSFANQFGGTGVTVSVQDPYTATNGGTSSSSNKSVALGVGLGIGLGVPLLVCLALAVFLIRKRRHNQEVSQGNAGAAEAPLVGEGQGQQQ